MAYFMNILLLGAEFLHAEETDGHGEANTYFP